MHCTGVGDDFAHADQQQCYCCPAQDSMSMRVSSRPNGLRHISPILRATDYGNPQARVVDASSFAFARCCQTSWRPTCRTKLRSQVLVSLHCIALHWIVHHRTSTTTGNRYCTRYRYGHRHLVQRQASICWVIEQLNKTEAQNASHAQRERARGCSLRMATASERSAATSTCCRGLWSMRSALQ